MLLASMTDVTFGFDDTPNVEQASLKLHSGEFVAVVGPNGSSKTTLLKLMMGLIKPWSGEIYQATHNERREKLFVSYIPQQISSFNSGFPSSILEFVESGIYSRGAWLGRMKQDDRQLVEQSLRKMGLWEQRKRRIGELSGGQKQRVCIARALAQNPDWYVCDEPTIGMDQSSRESFYQLMQRQAKEQGRSILMVTHELSEAEPYLDRVIQLERKENGKWKCCAMTSCKGHFAPAE